MARIRTIKPQLGRHRDLYDLEVETGFPIRFVWALFPTVCDREGRFIWRPWEIKLDILPYDSVDFDRLMDVLWTFGFLEKYQHGGVIYGCIPTFLKHQVVNAREAKSQIPCSSDPNSEVLTRGLRVTDLHVHAHGEGKGKGREKEGKGTDLRAVPRVPDASTDSNREAWNAYREAYFHRYQVEPARNAKVNSAIKQFVSRIGPADAPEVLRFFVSHNDSFYVRQTHSVSLALRDAETLLTQWRKGKAITQADVRRFEKSQQTLSLIDSIDREGV